ncbi:MAG: hypothetical protein U1G05_09480 [Kiritimatiellia bacterium]
MNLTPVHLFVALCLLTSCKPVGRLTTAQQPVDHSLNAAAYIAKGLPSTDRPWAGDDYARAAAVLKLLAASDITQLPRVHSVASSNVFSRFVAQENIALAITPSITSQQHIPALLALTQGVSQLAGVYASASQGSQVFDAELVDFLRYLLDVTAKIVPVVEEFLNSVSPDDPSLTARRKGQEQMKQGMASVVSGCLTTLTEHSSYRTAELLRLSNAMEQTLPVICPFLPQGTKRNYRSVSAP